MRKVCNYRAEAINPEININYCDFSWKYSASDSLQRIMISLTQLIKLRNNVKSLTQTKYMAKKVFRASSFHSSVPPRCKCFRTQTSGLKEKISGYTHEHQKLSIYQSLFRFILVNGFATIAGYPLKTLLATVLLL